MTKASEHIRVYQTTLANGDCVFTEKQTNKGDEKSYASITDLAYYTHWIIQCLHREDCQQVSIDFFPLHNIDCLHGFNPRLHTPLTEQQQAKFWEHFKKI